MPDGKPRAWTVVPGDDRALTIRSYEDGDPIDAAFVVVESNEPVGDLGRALEWHGLYATREIAAAAGWHSHYELERWHEARRALKRWGPESDHAAERRSE
jgi:hypothetical protein